MGLGGGMPLCLYWWVRSLSGEGESFRRREAWLRWRVDLRPGESSFKVPKDSSLRPRFGEGDLASGSRAIFRCNARALLFFSAMLAGLKSLRR